MFKKLFSGIQEKYNEIKNADARYQELLSKVYSLPTFYSYTPVERKDLTISHKLLMKMCPDLNEKDAVLIRGLIPIDEICLSCLYATECKSNVKFYFVPTTKYLWLIHSNGYLKYQYTDLDAEVIKGGVMSQVLYIANMLFVVNGVSDMIVPFVQLLHDSTYRNETITNRLGEFCGTVPKICLINDIGSGVSVGENHEIVFHCKDFHYKYMIRDIKNYELLIDDMVVKEKRSNRRTRLTANKNSCYEMTLRVTANDKMFLIPILEKSAFTSLYSSTNAVFIYNKAFADKIIDLLDNMDEAMLNGELPI